MQNRDVSIPPSTHTFICKECGEKYEIDQDCEPWMDKRGEAQRFPYWPLNSRLTYKYSRISHPHCEDVNRHVYVDLLDTNCN